MKEDEQHLLFWIKYIVKNKIFWYNLLVWVYSQVVRRGTATPWSLVQIRLAPPTFLNLGIPFLKKCVIILFVCRCSTAVSMRPCQGWDGSSILLTCSIWNQLTDLKVRKFLFLYKTLKVLFLERRTFFMLEFKVIEKLKTNKDLTDILKDFKYMVKLG